MAAITVANKDWAIINAVKTALAGATIEGSPVFRAVSVTTSADQARQCQFTGHPAAVIRYVTTVDDEGVDGERNCRLLLRILIATMVDAAGVDESLRLQEILRLKNAAINAVEASPPGDSDSVGDNDFHAPRIHWGEAEVDASGKLPWAVAVLPVEFGYRLPAATGH
jgi:hypothetical protein